jgi:hypothetical protein
MPNRPPILRNLRQATERSTGQQREVLATIAKDDFINEDSVSALVAHRVQWCDPSAGSAVWGGSSAAAPEDAALKTSNRYTIDEAAHENATKTDQPSQ